MNNKIAIYGGSFDPFHLGHFSIVNKLTYMNFNKIILLANNKSIIKKHSQTHFQHKHNMLKILFHKNTSIEISLFENQPKSIPSVQSLSFIKFLHPNTALHLCMGDDNFQIFNEWIDFIKILSLVDKFIIFSRMNKISIKNRYLRYLLKQQPHKFCFIDLNLPISSSNIRDSMKYCNDKNLDERILKYIKKNNLY